MSVLGIPLAFVFLATSAVWSGETHDRHTAAALVAGMALLAMGAVWTSISVLRRGPVYHGLRLESRPRRWVMLLLLIDFAVLCACFPVWMIRPQALFSRTLTLLFAITFFLVVMALRWFLPVVDP